MLKDLQANENINRLVLAVKNNDTKSFVELLGHFSPAITTLARSFSLPSSEEDDLCQEGRMALYRAALGYDAEGSQAQFSTYAVKCMTNAMISLVKKYNAQNKGKAHDVSPEDCDDAAYGAYPGFSLELDELISQEGFGGLSDYERRVIGMKLSGYKTGEIAKKLGKMPKSIENTLFRARQKLKKHIDG